MVFDVFFKLIYFLLYFILLYYIMLKVLEIVYFERIFMPVVYAQASVLLLYDVVQLRCSVGAVSV